MYEVIYVDDGSIDGSGELLDQLAAAHPHVRVHHQENSGWPGKPRIGGTPMARGRTGFRNLELEHRPLTLTNSTFRVELIRCDREGSPQVLIDRRIAAWSGFHVIRRSAGPLGLAAAAGRIWWFLGVGRLSRFGRAVKIVNRGGTR